jgi:hypothetical protein
MPTQLNILVMTLDANLRWKEHIKEKRDELNIKFRKMYWLLGRNSELSIHNKLTLYKQIIVHVRFEVFTAVTMKKTPFFKL